MDSLCYSVGKEKNEMRDKTKSSVSQNKESVSQSKESGDDSERMSIPAKHLTQKNDKSQ